MRNGKSLGAGRCVAGRKDDGAAALGGHDVERDEGAGRPDDLDARVERAPELKAHIDGAWPGGQQHDRAGGAVFAALQEHGLHGLQKGWACECVCVGKDAG